MSTLTPTSPTAPTILRQVRACVCVCYMCVFVHLMHHAHISGRNVFATEKVWREGRTRIRRETVTAFLRGLDNVLAKQVWRQNTHTLTHALPRQVCKAAERELRDMGLGDVCAAWGK